MPVTDIQSNEKKIIKGLNRAAADKADILLTPEGSLSGYHNNFNQDDLDESLNHIIQRIKELNIGIALGTCYKEIRNKEELCFNQVRLYSREGDLKGVHNKIVLCSPMDAPVTG